MSAIADRLFREGDKMVYIPNFSMKGKDFDQIRHSRLEEKKESGTLTADESAQLERLERVADLVDVGEF